MDFTNGFHKLIKSTKRQLPERIPNNPVVLVDVSYIMHAIHSRDHALALRVFQATLADEDIGSLVSESSLALSTFSFYNNHPDTTFVFEGNALEPGSAKRVDGRAKISTPGLDSQSFFQDFTTWVAVRESRRSVSPWEDHKRDLQTLSSQK